LPKELQGWCNNNNNGTIPKSPVPLPKVKKILDKYLAFDFEWDVDAHVIEAASFVDSIGNSKVLLSSDFDNCSEKELLKRINSKIMEYDWSIGWNSTGHVNNAESAKKSDLSILHQRCIANDIESIISLSPRGVPYIGHPKHVDLCNVYSKVMVPDTIYKKAYRTHKLDEVSRTLLGHGKYKDLSGKDFKSLPVEEQIEYSLRDSELVMELSKHNDFEVLDAMLAISEITELDFELVCRTNLSKWWSAIFDKTVKDRECQPRTATSFSGTYEGAEVLVPKQGLYHNVVVVDAISLYPSVAINHNISYDTVNCTCCKDDLSARITITLDGEFLKDCKFIKQDNNCWICKQKIGAFPKKLNVFKAEKLKQKKLGNNSKQLALKILINGAYGCFGFPGYAYYDSRVAGLVTAYGRQTLSKMHNTARDLGFEIVYGDTDSLFLHNPSKESLSEFKDLFNRQLDIELEIKNTYFNFILSSGKKHYLGYGVDDKGKEVLDVVGFEGNKNDRPEFVNNIFKQLVNDVIKDDVDPTLKLRHAMSDLEEPSKVNPDLLKISKVLGENPEDYKSQICQSSMIGKALGAKKGELIEYFDSNIKKTGKSWSVNPADIDIPKYKQTLWKTVREILEIAGYPAEDLAKEFGVKNLNKSKSTSGHGNA
jgi:DNA polymerase, archaea type